MTDQEYPLPWLQPGWQEQAYIWIHDRLSEQDIYITGPVEQLHARPWSTVLTVPTDAGLFYFKASAPVLRHEPALTQTLYRWCPDCMLNVLAVDLDRAWMLMPDQSPMLRALMQSKADLAHWETILPLYAGVQKEMMPRAEELLALGIYDRRLSELPSLFEQLLEDRPALMIDQEDGLTGEQFRRIQALAPRYAEMCTELAESKIPATLHHDDFHDANVFVPGGRYAFSDWGESCLAHPFFTMLVTLRSIAYRFDLAYGSAENDFVFAPEILRLRDVYLSCWPEYGSREELLRVFNLSWKTAMVNRAVTWHHVLAAVPEAERASRGYAVPAWLQEFLDAMEHL